MATQKIDRNMLNTGIVDNSNATAITIDSSENVTFAGTTQSTRLGLGVAPHGTAALNITSTAQHMRLNNGSELGIIHLLSSGELELWGHGDGESINFRTGTGTGTIAMNIVGTKLGIGTTGPAGKLHISGNSDVSDEDCQLIIDDVDGSAGSRVPSIQFRSLTGGTVTNQGRIRATDTQGMVLSGSSAQGDDLVVQAGKVKIGNTSGSGILNVNNGANDGGYVHFANNVGSTTLTNDQGLAFGWNKSNGGGESIIIGNQGAGSTGGLVFATNTSGGSYAERMRIDSSGNVSMGQSFTSGANLHVEDTSDSMLLIYETGTSPYTATLKLASQSMSSYGSNVQYTSNAEQLTIENYGRAISASSTSGGIRFRTKVGNSSMTEVLSINGNTGQVIQPVQYYTTTYRGGNQTVGAVTWTNWTFNSDLDNTGTNMRSADGVITFPIAGLYLVTGLLSVESPAATNYNQFRAAFGGTASNSPIFLGINELVSGNDYGYDIPISFMVKIANTGTDLMYIQAFSGSGNLTLRGGTSSSHLNVRLLG